ncbi:Ger(x)C family spore germination protein [Evansella sp. LMS18]|uniref:Ger(x)C family spore germination protein n=1 Tax=Evansella sp. LMS18 TaxID=2924033 RepID=UPI0020D0823B|nr:Ger(x)C family spore germination protein [Evansella sp. LMS18]UTR10242.1 Ger(x)C family spore germination protein [Evansella sp. LMS18]
MKGQAFSKKCFLILIALIFLCGCWDQRLLKETTLLMSAGFDFTEDGKLLGTVTSPQISKENVADKALFYSEQGSTPNQVRNALDRKVGEVIDPSKLRVIILGSELAAQPIYPILDLYYRDPRSSISSKLVVVEGTAKDAMRVPILHTLKPSEYILDLLLSAEESTTVPNLNLQTICPIMFDPGQDFMVPYLSTVNDELNVQGVAMFSNQEFTGTLDTSESTLFLLMDDKKGRDGSLTLKISDHEKQEIKNYITFSIEHTKVNRKTQVSKENQVKVDISLVIKAEVSDYPHDQLTTREEVLKLNDKLSVLLTEEAHTVMKKMQDANCDGFGIGRELIALYPETWKSLDWEKDYSNIEFNPTVTVEVIQHGIIN